MGKLWKTCSQALRVTATTLVVVALLVNTAYGGLQEGLAAYNSGDYATALREFRPLAEQGLAEAQHNLGSMYANGKGVPKDYRKAAQWYRRAAVQGDAEAQYNLGLMHAKGEGVPEDDREAFKWYRRAAVQGLAEAQLNLGSIYATTKVKAFHRIMSPRINGGISPHRKDILTHAKV